MRAAALSVHNLSFIPICVPPCGERGDLRGVQDGLRPSPRTFRRPGSSTLRESLSLPFLGSNPMSFTSIVSPSLSPGLLHRLVTLVADLGDVQQAVLTGHDLNKRAESDDRTDFPRINFAYLRNRYDTLDAVERSIERLLVLAEDVHETLAVLLGDRDGRSGGSSGSPESPCGPGRSRRR